MKQIDQDPGEYRVQRPDGTWTNRVNRKLCRNLAIVGSVFLAYSAWQFGAEGGSPIIVIFPSVFGAFVGALFMLSLRSID